MKKTLCLQENEYLPINMIYRHLKNQKSKGDRAQWVFFLLPSGLIFLCFGEINVTVDCFLIAESFGWQHKNFWWKILVQTCPNLANLEFCPSVNSVSWWKCLSSTTHTWHSLRRKLELRFWKKALDKNKDWNNDQTSILKYNDEI